ncbi:MAG: hypothetical protein WA957_09205 [Alteraurantiacibacter sp.]
MVSWNERVGALKNKKVVYLGLSCVSEQYARTKSASRLYYQFTQDAYAYEQFHSTKLILYGTTATPIILTALPKIWDNVWPSPDGTYSESSAETIEAIKRVKGLDRYAGAHPFVLKSYAADTRYSLAEKQRQNELCKKIGIRTFEYLDLQEENGDRLLVLCEVPAMETIHLLRKKLFLT